MPGVPYSSRDAAAIAAVEWIWGEGTLAYRREYSSAIYTQRTQDGLRFFHSDPLLGTKGASPPLSAFVLPIGATPAALVHTHPLRSPELERSNTAPPETRKSPETNATRCTLALRMET